MCQEGDLERQMKLGYVLTNFESIFIHNAKKGLITLVFPVITYLT